MMSPTQPDSSLGTIVNRRDVLWLAGSAVTPAMAMPWEGAARQRLVTLAQELGLTGWGARQLIGRVTAAVGPQLLEAHLHALLMRMESCHYAECEMADMLRMWSRDDFIQESTTIVEGVRFANTELALFELVRRA